MTLTVRRLLNYLNELKIIDNKRLTTKDVVYIFSDDNPNIFDFDHSYNLEYEVK